MCQMPIVTRWSGRRCAQKYYYLGDQAEPHRDRARLWRVSAVSGPARAPVAVELPLAGTN